MSSRKQAPLWLVLVAGVGWLALQWAAPTQPVPTAGAVAAALRG